MGRTDACGVDPVEHKCVASSGFYQVAADPKAEASEAVESLEADEAAEATDCSRGLRLGVEK
jgi:hypothetical protein